MYFFVSVGKKSVDETSPKKTAHKKRTGSRPARLGRFFLALAKKKHFFELWQQRRRLRQQQQKWIVLVFSISAGIGAARNVSEMRPKCFGNATKMFLTISNIEPYLKTNIPIDANECLFSFKSLQI
jgi:hypothetical protein